MRREFVIGLFCVALFVGAGFGVWMLNEVPKGQKEVVSQVVAPSVVTQVATTTVDAIVGPMASQEIMDEAFAAKMDWHVAAGTRVLIMPHHLVASREIASLVSAVQKPSIVYLISPDHFSQSRTAFTTTDASFETPYGIVQSSTDAVAQLVRDVPRMMNVRAPFEKEHGVTGLLPFFAHAWSKTPVVPVIVRIDATEDDRQQLAQTLTDILQRDPKALVVSTVDFSHYQTAEVADFHDELAQDVVTSLADRDADRVELDSPGALAVALKIARALRLGDVTIHAHTNSLRILQSTIAQDSTSHLLVSFSPGEIQSQKETSLLFVGDMMFDRTVRTRMQKGGVEYPFAQIRGQEDRFFRGQDAVIGNLEGPVAPRVSSTKEISFAFDPKMVGVLKKMGFDAVSQANNHSLDQGRAGAAISKKAIEAGEIVSFGDETHDDASSSLAIIERRGQKIALLGFNATEGPIDQAQVAKSVDLAKQQANLVVVFMHWGQEYHDKPNASQIDLAHWFIDHGVSAVIGSHPHWMESVEVYHGKMIAYSLGNFIFDQDWSTETNFGLAVGVEFKNEGAGLTSALHLFPIKIEQSQPRLLTGVERQARLQKLADISDGSLKAQILSGVVHSP